VEGVVHPKIDLAGFAKRIIKQQVHGRNVVDERLAIPHIESCKHLKVNRCWAFSLDAGEYQTDVPKLDERTGNSDQSLR
jgi:hypothetical protein